MAVKACTKKPIETQYICRLSERDEKDLSGSNLIVTPNIPILVFPLETKRGSQTEELTQLAVLFSHSIIVKLITSQYRVKFIALL